MANEDYLSGKRVLIVDDEPDILETLEELLTKCDIVRAATYEEAKDLLETQSFDMAILDIMGVDGFKLLDITVKKNIIAIMLTAHALSPENTIKSYKEGAALYVPKDKIKDIATYLEDVLEAKKKGKSFWWRWFDRFADYYERRFGPGWQKPQQDIWNYIEEERHKALRHLYFPRR
jgi:CheY-like chemotaxis protein